MDPSNKTATELFARLEREARSQERSREMDEKKLTATELMNTYRLDLRRRRAEELTHAILQAIDPLLDGGRRNARMDAYGAIMGVCAQQGVEVLTDHHRSMAGLPPRGPDGWTVEEMMALERARLDALLKPLTMPANEIRDLGEFVAERKGKEG